VFHNCTKEIDIDSHFMHEGVVASALEVRFISSGDPLADVFTKLATRKMIDRFRTNLNLVCTNLD
jgi:hypothetical protein